MRKLSRYTISELEKMPLTKKVHVYIGGEVQERTVRWLLERKREAEQKRERR